MTLCGSAVTLTQHGQLEVAQWKHRACSDRCEQHGPSLRIMAINNNYIVHNIETVISWQLLVAAHLLLLLGEQGCVQPAATPSSRVALRC